VLFVNAAMRGRYCAHDVVLDSQRGYSIVDTTTLQQIKNYGLPSEHLLPPDTGSGFIWRIYSIARYEQRDGGVYLEIEGIALNRDIPTSLRWLVNPVVNHLSVNFPDHHSSAEPVRQWMDNKSHRNALWPRKTKD
jgi:hypothetical protein